jgi:hypothetical protein
MEGRVVDGLNWKTQNKELIVVNKDPYGFMHFAFKEGGTLPDELSGVYTNVTDAQKAGDAYIKRKPRTHNADKERPVLQVKKRISKKKVDTSTIFKDKESVNED